MTEQNFIQVDAQLEEIREIRELENRQAEAETHCVDAYLRLKDECEERYRKLGKWVVDTIEDAPF